MKQTDWFLCVAKEFDWFGGITTLNVEWNRKLTAKAELNCEIYKSYTKCR